MKQTTKPVVPLPCAQPARTLSSVPHARSALVDHDDVLESEFKAACKAASRLSSVDTFQKLRIYAYFKQASVGQCNTSRPSMLDITGCAKWDAWKALGDLPAASAMEYYTTLVTELDQAGTVSSSEANGSGFSMGPTMSRMAESEQEPIGESDKDIFIYSGEGNQEAVSRLLDHSVDVNSRDDNGLTPLHWAVDRGNKDLAEFLILQRAKIDAQDEEQATPLHYAVDCDHPDLVAMLLRAGANKDILNAEGETADRGASSEDVRSQFPNC